MKVTPRCANSRGRDRTGLEFDMTNRTCSIAGCDKPMRSRGWCVAHWNRWRRNGDTGPAEIRSMRSGNPAGELNPSWRGDDVEYQAVHRRLRVYLGPARNRDCAACGGPARDWAYTHSDPDEKISAKVGLPFSTDMSHYRPLCSSCHNTLDSLHGWTNPSYFGRGVSTTENGRWRAYYTRAGRQVSLGRFDTREAAAHAAHEARLAMLTELDGHA